MNDFKKMRKAERERERSAKEADLFKQLSKELGHSNGGHQPPPNRITARGN